MLNLFISIYGNSAKRKICYATTRNQAARFTTLTINEELVPNKNLREAHDKITGYNYLIGACQTFHNNMPNAAPLQITADFWDHIITAKHPCAKREACKLLCQHLDIPVKMLTKEQALDIYSENQTDPLVFNLVMGIVNL